MENSYDNLVDKGIEAFQASKFQDAIQHFSKALDGKPFDSVALNYRSLAYRKLGEFNLALADIDSAILHNPLDADYYNSKAAILSSLHRQIDAIDELDKAINLHPLVDYVINKVVILKKLNRYRDALQAIEHIEAHNLDSIELKLYKAIILFDIRKYPESLALFKTLTSSQYTTIVNEYLGQLNKINN